MSVTNSPAAAADALPSGSTRDRDYGTHSPPLGDVEESVSRADVVEQALRARDRQAKFLERHAEDTMFTFRGVVVGLVVGSVVCFSNMYFGLQTGWVSMMSMPSSLIGFAIFRALKGSLKYPFTPVENVLVQTVAVAVGSMPLTAGFVGVIPALEKLLLPKEGGPINLSTLQLIIWSLGVAFFGVFFAVPLRRQVIIKEKLKFPSGTATALMIGVLHGTPAKDSIDGEGYEAVPLGEEEEDTARDSDNDSFWKTRTKSLINAFAVSGAFTLAAYFLPILRDLPVFGSTAASIWLWTLNPSPAYIGQGIIMGTSTTLHMLLGAVLGWGVLSPLAKHNGWAPGETGDWKKGSRGWIVWISLAIMLADSIVSLALIVYDSAMDYIRSKRRTEGYSILSESAPSIDVSNRKDSTEEQEVSNSSSLRRRAVREAELEIEDLPEPDAPPQHLVPTPVVYIGIVVSCLFSLVVTAAIFPTFPLYAIILTLPLALVLSIMGVRALGQTDLNPVSGISKLTQLIFALIVPRSHPAAIPMNLIAGAISEAGAMQAGELMQDLKTGHILGAAPRAQFYGQLIGAAFGALISAGIYRLYTAVYPVPGELFQVPTAYIWLDCSRLVFGAGLPEKAWGFSIFFGLLFSVTTVLKAKFLRHSRFNAFIPGGIAVAIGMYNTPSFTLARAIGGLLVGWYTRGPEGKKKETEVVVLASGLILGEGVLSIVALCMASFGVKHW